MLDNYSRLTEPTVGPEIEPAQVSRYLKWCEKNHDHSRLHDNRLYYAPIEITLIDTSDSRLARGSSRDRYSALSYVWEEFHCLKQLCQTSHPSRSLTL